MMQPHQRAWIDQEDARIRDMICRHGWAIEYIGGGECSAPGCDGGDDDGPAFGYTVGMFGLGHDELLVFGFDAHDTAGLLNSIGDTVQDGETILPGHGLTVGNWPHQIIPEQVPNPGDIVYSANRFYRRLDRHSLDVLRLSLHHRDPFDRLLLAQAQIEDLHLATADPVFSLYTEPLLTP